MRIRSTFIVATLCVFLSPLASAATIFSTFGPGETYNEMTYTPVNFYTSPEIIGTSLAFAFTVPNQSNFVLTEVRIAASWAGTKKNAHFLIHGDEAGLPTDLPLLSLAVNPDALLEFDSVVSLPAPSVLTLAAGQQYWLVVEPASLDSSIPADDFVQLWLNVDQTLLQTSRISFNSGPFGAWFDPAIQVEAPAFSIQATAVQVPEPGTLLLLAQGLLLLAWFSVARKRLAMRN